MPVVIAVVCLGVFSEPNVNEANVRVLAIVDGQPEEHLSGQPGKMFKGLGVLEYSNTMLTVELSASSFNWALCEQGKYVSCQAEGAVGAQSNLIGVGVAKQNDIR